jgi:hypothetical protein
VKVSFRKEGEIKRVSDGRKTKILFPIDLPKTMTKRSSLNKQ